MNKINWQDATAQHLKLEDIDKRMERHMSLNDLSELILLKCKYYAKSLTELM